MEKTRTTFDQAVVDAVRKGLCRSLKSLPSWLFYDEEGDRLFQQIMHMAEYYPTRCEYDILQKYSHELLQHFSSGGSEFQLIELGAGDGLKSEILLSHFCEERANFTYVPVDISSNALELLLQRLKASIPDLAIDPQNKSYDELLADLRNSETRKIILFMGANIGNFTIREAVHFLKRLRVPLKGDDMMLIGFDLKKDPRIVQEAYDDKRGITARFNLNILKRLNRDAGAEFDPGQFTHFPFYDPETGTTKSFLISMSDHDVYIEALGRPIHFYAWETIQTEVSQKYDLQMIEKMVVLSGMRIEKVFCDADKYFCDVLVRPA